MSGIKFSGQVKVGAELRTFMVDSGKGHVSRSSDN